MKQRVGISVGTSKCYVATRLSPDSPISLVNDSQDTKSYSTQLNVAVHNGKSVVGRDVDYLINSKNYEYIVSNEHFVEDLGDLDVKPAFDAGSAWYPVTLMATVFKKLVHDAKTFANEMEISDNVVSVPDNFHEFQNADILAAAKLAGMDVGRIIPRSEAVMAYFESEHGKMKGNSLMIDVADNVTNVNIVTDSPGSALFANNYFSIKMGGESFNNSLRRLVTEELVDFRLEEIVANDPFAYRQLLNFVEQAKIRRSFNPGTQVLKDVLEVGGHYFRLILDGDRIRIAFDEISKSLVDNLALKLASNNIAISGFDRIIITGGSSHVPELKKMLTNHFNGKQIYHLDTRTVKAAAFGAAILADQLDENNIDATSLITEKNIGITVVDSASGKLKLELLFPANVILPAEETKLIKTFRRNQNRIFMELREFDKNISDSKVIATLSITTKLQLRKEHSIGIEFTYDKNGGLSAFAYDHMTRKRFNCDLAIHNSGSVNMLQQQVLLKETTILNNITKPNVARF